jgi:hypothetical protein
MKLRVATLLITGLLFPSDLAGEAPRPLTPPEVVKHPQEPKQVLASRADLGRQRGFRHRAR